MRNLFKIVYLLLPACFLPSCSNSEEDYVALASSISNDVLIEVLDLKGNSLIDDENGVMDNFVCMKTNGYKIPFRIVEIGDEKIIRTIFPLPMKSSMSYSDDRQNGYGESTLTIKVDDSKYILKGLFHYSCSYPDIEMYGGSGIKIIEIHSDNPNVSISEDANFLKITIKIASD